MNNLKPYLIASIILNAIFLVLLVIYLATPYLDYALIQKSLPRLCEFAQENNMFDSTAQKGLCRLVK